MKTHIAKTARTLLMITVMIASAIMPMIPEAAELRDSQTARHTAISTDVSSLDIYEGDLGWYNTRACLFAMGYQKPLWAAAHGKGNVREQHAQPATLSCEWVLCW